MKKRDYFWSLLTIAMVVTLSIGFTSCSKDDKDDELEQTENVSNQDPEGTIVLNMLSGSDGNYYKIGELGEIHVDAANNFRGWDKSSEYKIEFVTIGKVEGLGKINNIPISGWAESAAVVPGTGYMMRYTRNYWDGYNNNRIQYYARIYVVDYLTTATTDEFGYTSGGNSGATIKYQAPLQQIISLDSNSMVFPNQGGRKSLNLKYSTHLNIMKKPEWCSVEVYMDSVVVSVGGNTDNERTGEIVLSNLIGEATVSIAQGAVEPIEFEKNTLSFTNKVSSQSIKLKTPTYYEIDSIPDWCTSHIYMDSLVVSVQENTSIARSGEIIVKNALSKATIKVSQDAITSISLEKTFLSFTNKASSQTIKLVEPTLYEIDESPEWCNAKVFMDSVVVSVQENRGKERRGELILMNDAGKSTITIVQESFPEIKLEKTSLTFTSKTESQTVKLKTPTIVELEEKPEWCYVKTTSDSIVVTVIDNLSASQRTGNVILKNAVGTATLSITQAASSSPLFENGLGTIADPYQIKNAQQLENIGEALSSHFVLTADIDLKSYLYEYGNGWEPLDNFKGTFDGKGHSIKGLWMKRPSTNNIGIFSSMSGAIISNLKVDIDEIGITGSSYVGSISGVSTNSKIYNCSINGKIMSNNGGIIGALCGQFAGGSIESCSMMGTITSNGNNMGGLCGEFTDGSINNSFVKGTLISKYGSNVGGLCGSFSGTSIKRCSFSGTIEGHGNVGGLCGSTNSAMSIIECKSEGTITTSYDRVAGIVGQRKSGTCNITDCYSVASLSGDYCDGISHGGNHTRCYFAGGVSTYYRFTCGGTYTYFDSTVSGQSGSNGYSTEDMMKQATYESWDFKNVWKITEGKSYPTLRCFDK